MGIRVNIIKAEISNLKKFPKHIKHVYIQGVERDAKANSNKFALKNISKGTKNVVKEIGPATTGLTVLGTILPIPFTSVVGFGIGKIIDKTLKYFKLIK